MRIFARRERPTPAPSSPLEAEDGWRYSRL